jgi:predicted  nucleic acid-binding Zn-ribbon protein
VADEVTGAEIMAVVGFFVMLSGAGWGVWWRIEGRVRSAEDKAGKVRDDLAAHKLHVAETYTTKAGMLEQTAAIMKAIDSVGDKIDRTNERLDRVFEGKSSRRAPT